MLDSLVQQFAGGGGSQLEGSSLFGSVAQMLEGAPNEHGTGAIGEALSALGGGGFGQSVAQGSSQATPEQRNGLGDLLTRAISQGGGSPSGVLSQLGIGGSSMGPQELGTLAQFTGEHNPDALAQVLGNHFGGGGGSGMLSLLGNPMVRQVGMNLARRLL